MIYVLIAGSYTPFCLLVLDGATGKPGAAVDRVGGSVDRDRDEDGELLGQRS
ncbi:MAG: hypothetical protein U0V56_10745 [Actinomycetota bacterium]